MENEKGNEGNQEKNEPPAETSLTTFPRARQKIPWAIIDLRYEK